MQAEKDLTNELDPELDLPEIPEMVPSRLVLLSQIDRNLAWVVALGPPIGFVLAIKLYFSGLSSFGV